MAKRFSAVHLQRPLCNGYNHCSPFPLGEHARRPYNYAVVITVLRRFDSSRKTYCLLINYVIAHSLTAPEPHFLVVERLVTSVHSRATTRLHSVRSARTPA
jgi:hypothetical protein